MKVTDNIMHSFFINTLPKELSLNEELKTLEEMRKSDRALMKLKRDEENNDCLIM